MEGWTFLRFVHALRQASLTISSQDIHDAQTCLIRFPNLPEKLILKSIFIRRPQDVTGFEIIWKILFQNTEYTLTEENAENCSTRENGGSWGFGGQGVGHGSGGISLTEKGNLNASLQFTRNCLQRFEGISCDLLSFEETVKSILTEMDYYTWINTYDLAYHRGELTEEEWGVHQNQRISLVHEIRDQLMMVQVSHENSWQPIKRQYWLYKALSTLTEEEKHLVQESIRKWARRLAVRPGGRWRESQRGTLDISRIVQHSVQWNCKIFSLSYRKRASRAAELVVLCDVSNSMAAFIEFLIYMGYEY